MKLERTHSNRMGSCHERLTANTWAGAKRGLFVSAASLWMPTVAETVEFKTRLVLFELLDPELCPAMNWEGWNSATRALSAKRNWTEMAFRRKKGDHIHNTFIILKWVPMSDNILVFLPRVFWMCAACWPLKIKRTICTEADRDVFFEWLS